MTCPPPSGSRLWHGLVLSFALAFLALTGPVHCSFGRHRTGRTTRSEHFAGHHVPRLVDLPTDIRRVILNVGCNADPPTSPDAETAVIAVEPLPRIAASIPSSDRRYVLTAAVSDSSGISVFHNFGDSSSLSGNPTGGMKDLVLKKAAKTGSAMLVPTISMAMLLRSFSKYECWYVKTDMQGFDFTAIRSAGAELLRCPWVQTEVYCNGYVGYAGAQNDYERDWLPHMTAMGFAVETNGCNAHPGVAGEANVLWRNTHLNVEAPSKERCPRCYT